MYIYIYILIYFHVTLQKDTLYQTNNFKQILISVTLYGPVSWGLLGSRTELIWTIVAWTIKLDGSNLVQVNTSCGLIRACPVACWSNEYGFVPGVIYQSILKSIFSVILFYFSPHILGMKLLWGLVIQLCVSVPSSSFYNPHNGGA